MKHYYDVCLGPKGLPIPNVSVTVWIAGTGQTQLATIYSDDGITTKANPTTSDALGNVDFYVADGRYDLQFSGPGITSRLETDIEISDITQAATSDSSAVFKNLNNIRFADQFANIAAAVTDAGTTGSVIIPANYSGTDNAQANSVPTMDFRQNSQAGIAFYHGVRSLFPSQSNVSTVYPGGHDFPIVAFGPADIPIVNGQIDCTSSTSIVGAGTNTITVGTCADSSGYGGPSGDTSKLSHAAGVALILEPGTANEEAVSNANWSILSPTTLSVTTTLNHTQPYTVRQQGITDLVGRVLRFHPPSGSLFYYLDDANNNIIAKVPANTGGTFPNNAWQWTAIQTGNGGNETHRNATSSSVFVIQNSAGTASIAQVSEAGGAGILTMGNPTNNSFQLQASADLPRLSFGGTTTGALIYGSRGAGGTSGIFRFRNNQTDDTDKVQIDTSATPSVRIFGSTSGSYILTAPAVGGTATFVPTGAIASTSQKSETAADTSVLSFTPPAAAGTYRLRFVLSLSAANAATLGWTATWTDSNGNAKAPTNLSLFQVGAAAPALTFTTSTTDDFYGDATIDVNNSATAIVIKLTFSGTSFTGKASATIERLI